MVMSGGVLRVRLMHVSFTPSPRQVNRDRFNRFIKSDRGSSNPSEWPPSLGLLARRPSRRATISALLGRSLIIEKIPDHDVGVSILGMYRVMALSRDIRIFAYVTTNLCDPPRTVLLAPLLDQVNCVRG